MAIVSCPECGKKLKIGDALVGKKVKCTAGHVFVAQTNGEASTPPPSGRGAGSESMPEKVLVACTECAAKLKVAMTSLGKKMKCPKCTSVFVAALADDAPPKPVKKAAPPAVDDDDLFNAAQDEVDEEVKPKAKPKKKFEDDEDDDARPMPKTKAKKPVVDEDEEDEPAPKAKAKKKFDDEDEVDEPAPKAKTAKPPRVPAAPGEKPVYPSRLLPNILVALLLVIFIGLVGAVFMDINLAKMIGLPEAKGVKPKKGPIVNPANNDKDKESEKDKAQKDEIAKFNGTWVVMSAEMPGLKLKLLTGKKFVFADGKVTTPDPLEAPFQIDATKDPKWIEMPTSAKMDVPGIYAIEGDQLKLCTALPKQVIENGQPKLQPGERPTVFDAKQGVLMILRRETKKDGDKDKDAKDKDGKDKDAKDKDGKAVNKGAAGSKLDGVWLVERAEENGVQQKEPPGARFHFSNGKIRFPDVPVEFGNKVDESKNPAWIDFEVPKLGTVPGIFKIDGDKLHWAFASPGKDGKIGPRPSAFDSKSGMLMVLRRATKADLNAPAFGHRMSQNNLKQIVLAMHSYHDVNKFFPPAAIHDATGKPLLSWRVAILPYVDEIALYKEFDLTKPWDDPHNKKLIAKMPKTYVAPGTDGKAGKTHYRTLVGPGTVLEPQKGPDGKMIARRLFGLKDGSSNCIVVLEAKDAIEWTRPDDLPYNPKGPLPKFGVAPDGFNVAFADGRVELVPANVPESVLRPYLTCENGMPREPLSGKK